MPETEQDSSLVARIAGRIAKINPVRLVLIVSAVYYLIKNAYIYYTTPRAHIPDLPADHDERVAKQTWENLKRGGGQIVACVVLLVAILFLRYINNKQADHDQKAKEKDEEIKRFQEMVEEERERKKKITEEIANKRKSKSKKDHN